MSVASEQLAARFHDERGRLVGIAYRLTGSVADAEDAVQESWLRLSRLSDHERAAIRDLGAWLTTVISRICLDRMRSAAARRERYVGPWLPEPYVAEVGDNPADLVLTQEDLRMAALRVVCHLSPEQRLAFVLHDGFAVPFSEIAELLACSVAAARQHASRARRVLSEADPPPRTELAEQRRLLEEFLAAVSARDLPALARVLHPDVTFYGDSGGKARTARRPVVGRDKVARFAVGLMERYGDGAFERMRLALVNGDIGLVVASLPGGEDSPAQEKVDARVLTIAVRDGRISALFDVANPDKLAHLPL